MPFRIIKLIDRNIHIRYKESSFTLVQPVYAERHDSEETRVNITLWMLKHSDGYVAFDTNCIFKKLKAEGKGEKDEIHIRKNRRGFTAAGVGINDCILHSNTGFTAPEDNQQIAGLDELIKVAAAYDSVDSFYAGAELKFIDSYKSGDNATIVYEFNVPASIKQKNLLIFFVAWMKKYQGITSDDKPLGGGGHVDKTGECGEAWNFQNVKGYCYGYGMTSKIGDDESASGVNLEQLLPGKTWKKGDVGKGIDIVYIANNTSGEHCVVGWHKDADVFHKDYDKKLLKDLRDNTSYGYLSKTKTENATLVEESERQPIPKRLWDGGQTRHMYPATRPELTEWLYRYINNSIETAKAENDIAADPNLSLTEKEQLTKSRIGQGKFRAAVLKHRNYRCVLTKIETEELLIASHIKPWAKSDNGERLDPHNGLLLAATHDKLFDQGYITFDENGTLQISSELSAADREKLFQKENIQCDFSSATLEYLKHHRDNIFKP